LGEIAYQNKDVASKVTGEALVGKSLAPFGLAHLKIVGILPTNLPAVESNELRLDNLFLLSDGAVAIIDYESDFSRENFIKYINYIARVMKRYAVAKKMKELNKLKVVVIYTADVEEAEEVYDLGGILLRVEAAYLVQMDTGSIYRKISQKIEAGEMPDDEELIELMILPLTVKGQEDKQEWIVKAVELAKKIPDPGGSISVLSGILTFTDKIIDPEYSQKIKEAMMLTKVERLFYEDGRKEGRKEGEERLGSLMSSLFSDERYKDAKKASTDAEYREKLYLEYELHAVD